MHRAESLYRHRDRDDHLAAFVDAHNAALLAVQRLHDFLVTVAVLRPEFAIERQVAAVEPGADRDHRAFGETRLFHGRRRQFEAQHVTAAVEIAAVEDEPAVAIVNTGTVLVW